MSNNARTTWMNQMLSSCFGSQINESLEEKKQIFAEFLAGKRGQSLLVYFQKDYKYNERNEITDANQISTIYINEGKNVLLRNKAAFFIRNNIPEGKEFSNQMLQTASDNELIFGEITNDSILCMNKVIYHYLYQALETNVVDNTDWGKIEVEQKWEFKKILETFARDMNDTVESLITGVKFAELTVKCKDFILKDNTKDYFISEQDSVQISKEIEKIYKSWIETLNKEIEDMEKEQLQDKQDIGPKYELEKWKYRMQRLTSVNDFFKSNDFRTVSKYFNDLKNKSSSVVSLLNEMKQKKIDSHSAHNEAKDNVKYLSTLEIYFEPLYNGTPDTIIDSLQSLMNSLKLISFTARYYDNTKMTNLFSRITEQMIATCQDYILDNKKDKKNIDPEYLWTKQPSDLIVKFHNCIKLYNHYKEKYKDAKTSSTSTNKENNFEFGEHQLFGKFEQFCKRLTKLIELFTTIKQFDDIKKHKLDSMDSIEKRYDEKFDEFKGKQVSLLSFSVTKFDKEYVTFNLGISEIETELHKIINEEFKNLNSIEKKLKLLHKYEKILTKPNLQGNLKSEKIEIFSNYKREIDHIQTNFEAGRTSPKLQRNMPKISGKIKWAKHLFNRIHPYIHSFKDISIKDRSETEQSYFTTNTLLLAYILLNEKFFDQFVEQAKNKLNAPLIVVNERDGPRVNLDLYVLQLIREAKCMLRMQCKIPEAAKIILLQEDKFKKYYNELNFLVKEYNRVLSRIVGTEAEAYFKSHIKDLNLKLLPLKTTINWTSMNIDSNLMNVFNSLQKLEQAIDTFYDVLENRVHKNMMTIRKEDLLEIPENATSISINELIKSQDKYINEKNILLLSKNSEIESSILDIIGDIKAYKLDPKIQPVEDKTLYKLMYDYEDKFYDFLITTTKNSLNHLKERISASNGETKYTPIFKVEVVLVSNQIEIYPKISIIQETINKLAKSILYAMKGITSWEKPDSKGKISFHTKIGRDNEIVKMILLLTGSIQSNHMEIDKYLKNTFQPFKHLWTDSIEKKIKEFNSKKNKTYLDYEEKLKEYLNIEKLIKAIADEYNIGAICLNTKAIKAALDQCCNDWKNAYSRELQRTTRDNSKKLDELIKSFQQKLKQQPDKIQELKEVVSTIDDIRRNEGEIEMYLKPYVELYNLVQQHSKESFLDKILSKTNFDRMWQEVLIKAGKIRDTLQNQQLLFRKKLFNDINSLKKQVVDLKEEYDREGTPKAKSPEDAHDRIERFRTKTNILRKQWITIKNGEELFNLSNTSFPQLVAIEDELKLYGQLYDLYMEVKHQVEDWKDKTWIDVKDYLDDMEKKGIEFDGKRARIKGPLVGSTAYNDLKDLITIIINTVECFKILNYPNYEEHHWKEISDLMHVPECASTKSDGGLFKLKYLFDANVHNFRNQLEEIQNMANNQQKIKDSLNGIDDYWRTADFKFSKHNTRKDVDVLDAIQFMDIKTNLEEHAGKVAGFKSQQKNLTAELNSRIKTKELLFQNILNTMELWYGVQTLWTSLQSFFVSGDIKKDLPVASREFEKLDKEWVKLMEKAVNSKNAQNLCGGNENAPTLLEIDTKLKECQKHLDNYLENKRGAFPRFYFVSNSVLLEILSKRTDPASIKNNLNIIFDAINDIEFEEEKKYIGKILQRKSEGSKDVQEVSLGSNRVRCDGKIEDWLNDLVKSMNLSIKDIFKDCHSKFRQLFDVSADINEIKTFVKMFICQAAVFGLMILGTKKLEEFVQRTCEKGESYKKKIKDNRDKREDPTDENFFQIKQILTEMCRGDNPNKLEQVKLETLIIIHVHNIDIFDSFLKPQDHPISVNDYDWLKQTRVYWITNPGTCVINITDVPFEYAYEFLGAKERMCITELTDKCYITLAQALGMNYGGAPAGPAGTGKTETVKDMGRSMGVFVLVTNCAPEHRYKDMAQIFKGLCRSGAWGCFDEFNRIELEVLSVVAMQISAIQEARKAGKKTFKFPGEISLNVTALPEIELLESTAYFITMNPGYSGRQELPENLKVLFRGVTMMLPDRQAIIRVKLSSYGFDRSEDLSKKFKFLYDLCEAQLSKQQHYDFGLRNILSVLRHAGNEKKKDKSVEKEEEILFVALRDMNESKLVPDDIQLFLTLIKDVFPEQKSVKNKDYSSLKEKIYGQLEKKKLDANEDWIKKIIQTFETSVVRHGFMLVGDTGSGKSTIMEVLTDSMSEMETKKDNKWKIHRLNPKAVNGEFLFIQKVFESYILGVFTCLWKKCNETTSSYSKGNNWLVCDGPIDSKWIESLNTVLDDNKVLTLSNNDRIQMLESCRLLFECENLKNATLATVSRCGMIYLTEDDLGIQSLINGWFLKNDDIFKDNRSKATELRNLIEKKYLTKEVRLDLDLNYDIVMYISWMIRVKNFFLIIEGLLNNKKEYLEKNYLERVVVFAMTWGVGSLYEPHDRIKFHIMLEGLKAPIPPIDGEKTIFEYRLDSTWAGWENPDINIKEKDVENFSMLLIPTMDSSRAIFLIELTKRLKIEISSDRSPPCLLLGDAGTAKTSTILIYKKLRLGDKEVLKRINFSSATSPKNFQESVDDELDKAGNEYVPQNDRFLVVFIDDVSMPNVNEWGDQMTLELARQLLEFGGYYFIGENDNRGNMKKISKVSFIAAMNHPKGGKNNIPNRLKRHFFIFNMVLPNEQSVNEIYGKILKAFFTTKTYGEQISSFAASMVKPTIMLNQKMKAKFLPTPVKFHYNFNMREISRVFQGLFNINKDSVKTSVKLFPKPENFIISLWKHEGTRVFSDKLTDIEDKKEFKIIIEDIVISLFGQEAADAVKDENLFCDFLRPPKEDDDENGGGGMIFPKVYELVDTMESLKKMSEYYMNSLREDRKRKQVNIVLFDDCLKYLIRVTRVLRTPQGSLMMVGVGGSGKQSLTRLASYICQQAILVPPDKENLKECFKFMYNAMIENYNPNSKKDLLKHAFVLTDADIRDDSYLELISSFLATGEIANLYIKKEEKLQILSATRAMLIKKQEKEKKTDKNAEQKSLDDNEVWIELINSARNNVHIILCFSPSGDKFRLRFIKFPILFNNCTMIFLLPWPEEALINVAKGFVEKKNDKGNKVTELVGTPKHIEGLYKHMAAVHTNINKLCAAYLQKMRKFVYVTPKSYLSFIEEYIKIYNEKKIEISEKENTIINGLKKLESASRDIDISKKELRIQMDALEEDKKKVEIIEKEVAKTVAEISKSVDETNIKKEQTNKKADEISKEAALVKKDLDDAEPKLIKAVKVMNSISADQIAGYTGNNVSFCMKYYFECSTIIMGKRLSTITDILKHKFNKEIQIVYFNLSWDYVVTYLKNGAWFKTLQEFKDKINESKLSINDETLELIQPLLLTRNVDKNDQEVFEETVASFAGGTAAVTLMNFCKCLDEYVNAVRECIPKKQALDNKIMELDHAKEEVRKVEKELEEKNKIKEAKELELTDTRNQKEEKEAKADRMKKIVEQATNLIESLGGERERWTIDAKNFERSKKQLLGDSSICAAFLAYAGPFNFDFRSVLVKDYLRGDMISKDIPFTDSLIVEDFLIDEKKKGKWIMNKLPSDILSIQNGILVKKSSRYPLLIDPQNQAKTWLLASSPEFETNKTILNMNDFVESRRFEDRMISYLRDGDKIIIESIENDVNSKLDQILDKQIVQSGGKKLRLMFAGKAEDFDPKFKMFLLCKLISPHFSPELAAKSTIIDFNVTIIGLEQQLQGAVISKEQKHLEETLRNIMADIKRNKDSLVECQKAILENLNKPGDLLQNQDIVIVLGSSKSKSDENNKKIKEAEEKKIDINQKREKYLPVATRGAVLYFSVVDMQEISKMYSTSLQQFSELFEQGIDTAIPSNHTETRVKNIVHRLTEQVYRYINRGLFERDKLAFVFLVCFKILYVEKAESGSPLLDISDISFFTKVGASLNEAEVEDCPIDTLVTKGVKKPEEWLNLVAICNYKFRNNLTPFSKLMEKIKDNQEKFKNFFLTSDAENALPYDDIFNQTNPKLAAFLKLIFIRALRKDRTLVTAANIFIPTILEDKEFLKPYAEEISEIYTISSKRVPILFLLSAGADPTSTIENFAVKKGKKPQRVSMGEGQEKIAESFTFKGKETGEWILLQNCHLGLPFMKTLDSLLKNPDEFFHEEFRIWLSCEPRNEFPIGLLHQSLKVTNEPPKGIAKSMIKTFSSVVSQDMIDKYEFKEWRNLVFTLSFLHSLVLERRKYGALGWCIPYDFNNSDLESSILFVDKQFQRGLETNDKMPPKEMINFKTLVNVISTILYGGRITDRKDGELFQTIIWTYLDDTFFTKPNFCFYPLNNKEKADSKSKAEYKLPDDSVNQKDQYQRHISLFPAIDPPQVFGLHPNADLTFRLKEFGEILNTMMNTLPKEGGGGGKSKESEVKDIVFSMIKIMPPHFLPNEYRAKISQLVYSGVGKGLEAPLHNVLLQEVMKIQEIIQLVGKSLVDIRDAVDGKLMMTEDIMRSIDSLYASRPPNIWMYNANGEEISWISVTASTWFVGLNTRARKLKEWLNSAPNTRPSFFLPGFLNPQGFFAAFKQEVYKIKRAQPAFSTITLDMITMAFNPDKSETDPDNYTKNADKRKDKDSKGSHYMYIYGLFIEGALWTGSLLDDPESNSRNTVNMFPVIVVVGEVETPNKAGGSNTTFYKCPVYKYPKRTDKYFIIEIQLRTSSADQDQKFWQKRGVAMLCNKE